MLSRRDLLKSAAAGAAVAAVPGAARAQAKKKPTLTIAFPSSPETIDPHQLRSVLSGSILGLMGEGLLTRDPQTMEIKPLLAESWKNLNPNTWEIKLRRGVKFHNGEEFTAESVKFTVERAIASKLNTLSKLTWPPSFGQDVLIVDPYTVRIITKIPDPMVPSRLAAESMCMAPAKGLAEYKDKFVPDRYIGTGPFRLAEYVVGDRVVVEANPSYWGPKPPSQRVVWQVIPDPATRLAALQRGDVDVMLNLPFPLVPNVESDPSLRLYSELSSLTHGILLNARESVIACFRALDPGEVILGQYDGYRDVEGVAPDSDTDTFIAARLWVDTDRWRGVPFLLRTGKRLAVSEQRVTLRLKAPAAGPVTDAPPTMMSLSLKGTGELDVEIVTKKPGPEIELTTRAAPLPFSDDDGPDLPAYATLIRDVLEGDRSLFTSSEGLAAAWRVLSPVLEKRPAVQGYAQGSWGPDAATALAGPGGWYLHE